MDRRPLASNLQPKMPRLDQAPRSVSAPRYSGLPANDRADELTAAMLAQLLEQAGHAALSLPIAHTSPAELLALVDIRQNDVVCVSTLPPYAFPPARTMCKLIRMVAREGLSEMLYGPLGCRMRGEVVMKNLPCARLMIGQRIAKFPGIEEPEKVLLANLVIALILVETESAFRRRRKK